jgi:hypothetical protein
MQKAKPPPNVGVHFYFRRGLYWHERMKADGL